MSAPANRDNEFILALTPDQYRTVRAALDDAWYYRMGEASGIDDPDLEPYDRAALEDLERLPTLEPHDQLNRYPSADRLNA